MLEITKCPYCHTALTVDELEKAFVCEECGSEYDSALTAEACCATEEEPEEEA